MKITAHTLVKNEERFLWYSVKSVIEYVDKMLLWDTGSTDQTKNIIKALKKAHPDKINTRFVIQKDIYHFTELRQEMLENTKTEWFIIADGDEVWWKDGISKLTETINKNPNVDYLISKYYSPVGDMFHYQLKNQAKYQIKEHSGHINIRATKTSIKGLHFDKPHGQQGLFDHADNLIQDKEDLKYHFLPEPAYLHMTNLVRSTRAADQAVSKRGFKYKVSRGVEFPLDFYYPESFFFDRPEIVSNIWENRDKDYELKANLLDGARFLKKFLPHQERSGY